MIALLVVWLLGSLLVCGLVFGVAWYVCVVSSGDRGVW